jgi:integrase
VTEPAKQERAKSVEAQLRAHLRTDDGKSELLFTNKRGRALSANKLRAKQLHPLLEKLGIPRGGFHSMRHGAASALLADGATPTVVQRQLRHSDARITLGVHGTPSAQSNVTLWRVVPSALSDTV